MRPLRYAINVTLDGCVDHRAVQPDEEVHRFWAGSLTRADALLFGRVTYRMMEEAWRRPADGTWPDWMDDGDIAFARSINEARKHVVSRTIESLDWHNSELVRGDLGDAVRRLKAEPAAGGDGIQVGGVTLPLALANLGLIDEYEFVVHPVVAGQGPNLLDGLAERVELELVDRRDFASGAFVLRLRPRDAAGD